MEQDYEEYLGGFASPFLGRGRLIGAGFGISVTTKRVIGFRTRKVGAILFVGPILGGIGALLRLLEMTIANTMSISLFILLSVEAFLVIIGGLILILAVIFFPTLSVRQNPAASELHVRKDFEIVKEEIDKMVLGTGAFTIQLKIGPPIRIGIGHRKVFRQIKELMRLFYPEALRLA